MIKKRNEQIIPDRLKWIMNNPPQLKNNKEVPYKPQKLTQNDLSSHTGVTVRNIQYARTTGSIAPDSLLSICKFLDVDPEYLRGGNVPYSIADIVANNLALQNNENNISKTDLVKLFDSARKEYDRLKSQNRIDNNENFIGYYNENISYSDIKEFIESYMNSVIYINNDMHTGKYTFDQIEPYIDEYCRERLPLDLNLSIDDFIDEKLKGSKDNGRNKKEN